MKKRPTKNLKFLHKVPIRSNYAARRKYQVGDHAIHQNHTDVSIALGGFVKPNIIMKTLDEKAAEYSARLSNQSGNYTKGEIETAYVVGASENAELTAGEPGTFGQALVALQRGYNIARKEWGGKCFIVNQINSDIASDIVPKMQSLPDAAKRKIGKSGDGSIHYRDQCLVVYPDPKLGCMATNYIPDWQDMFSDDWIIVK